MNSSTVFQDPVNLADASSVGASDKLVASQSKSPLEVSEGPVVRLKRMVSPADAHAAIAFFPRRRARFGRGSRCPSHRRSWKPSGALVSTGVQVGRRSAR